MIPSPGKTLQDLATRIVTHLVPATHSNFAQADGALLYMLLLSISQDYERAAFNRMADIDEIKALCRNLLAQPLAQQPGDAMQASMQSLLAQTPASLMLKDLTQFHADAFELLIELHAWAERNDSNLNLEIWRLLRRHSERNKFDVPGP
jgi:hypothetical protein